MHFSPHTKYGPDKGAHNSGGQKQNYYTFLSFTAPYNSLFPHYITSEYIGTSFLKDPYLTCAFGLIIQAT